MTVSQKRKQVILIIAIALLFAVIFVFNTQAVMAEVSPAKPGVSMQGGWTCEDILKNHYVNNVRVSPDGKKVVFVVIKPVMTSNESEFLCHIYMSDINGKNTFQLTHGNISCTDPQWSPDGNLIAFLSARSGKNNLWIIRANGGEAYRVSDVKTGVFAYEWSPDGKKIAFLMADPKTEEEEKRIEERNDAEVMGQNIKCAHIHIISTEKDKNCGFPVSRLTNGNFIVLDFNWSPDGKNIVFSHTPLSDFKNKNRSDISTVNLLTSKVKPLVVSKTFEYSPFYSPDGKWIAYIGSETKDKDFDAKNLFIIPSVGGKPVQLAKTPDQAPYLLGWSRDGKNLYASENDKMARSIYLIPINGKPVKNFSKNNSVIHSISLNKTGTMMGFTMQNIYNPVEAYVSNLSKFKAVKVSNVNKAMKNMPLGRTEVIKWKSTDGKVIEGLLTYPVNYKKGIKYPLLLYVHGGPASVFRNSYLGEIGTFPLSVFASRGYAILRCNIRGSSGYGIKFRKANMKDWGGMDFKDLMTGVDHVIKMGVADSNRLGVAGWSYGGYMTAWIITQTNRFKAASVGAGISDLVSMEGTNRLPDLIPAYFKAELWEDFQLYVSRSAIAHIKNVKTPTLIQHGINDITVPYLQGIELYTALKRRGVPVKMVTYPRSGHMPSEPKLILDCNQRNVEWFETYVPVNE